MAAQSTSVLIMQSSPSLREIQPETGAVSMDKCYLSIALLLCQSSSNSLVRASDWNSEDPGLNPGWISMSFFRHHSTLQIKIPFNNSTMVAKRGSGRVSAWGTLHMAATLAGCRMALVFSDCKDKGNTLKPYPPQKRRLVLVNVHRSLT